MACIFCSIIAGEAPGHILSRTEKIITFLSLEGHPLVAPTTHVENLEALDDEASAEIFVAARHAAMALRVSTGCEGINLVLSDGAAAGQDVFHLHLHVKPRWIRDDVKLSWPTERACEDDRATLANDLRLRLAE